jgi:hypothetical protein
MSKKLVAIKWSIWLFVLLISIYTFFSSVHYVKRLVQDITKQIVQKPAAGIEMRQKMMKILVDLAQINKQEKKHIAIYIPKTNRIFWQWSNVPCFNVPTIAPMISGIAMIHGLASDACLELNHVFYTFGYINYDLSNLMITKFSDKELCAYAKTKGFSKLFIIDYKDAILVTRWLNCA